MSVTPVMPGRDGTGRDGTGRDGRMDRRMDGWMGKEDRYVCACVCLCSLYVRTVTLSLSLLHVVRVCLGGGDK